MARPLRSVAAFLLAALPALALAQPAAPPGRTDGPEGTEIGQGGYRRAPGPGAFQITFDAGGAISSEGPGYPLKDRPYFLGADLAWSPDDWLLLELTGAYDFDLERTLVLVGPRLRTPASPFSLSAGVKGGVMHWNGRSRFGLSPQIGAELEASDRFVLGLHYALDIPVEQDTTVTHRIFLGLGLRL
ncbi:conserved hypothetical protein [Anaeromyxobacter sp. K]|uniref:hypothetical protein n=1 Tax=Anaeromyxobacter sp. (strain K) TaxID=447217 RepID=UPI00015F8863|nr:hypothetical protein [Anaeromyxobacter sp. K]ACG73042.1 conserved hypothetical protein [Anaeromyxobacter sp. K]